MLANREFYIKLLEIMIPLKPTHQLKDKSLVWKYKCVDREDGEMEDKVKEKWKRLERGCRRGRDSQGRGSDTNMRYPARSATVLSPLTAQLVSAVSQKKTDQAVHTAFSGWKLSLNWLNGCQRSSSRTWQNKTWPTPLRFYFCLFLDILWLVPKQRQMSERTRKKEWEGS